MRALAIFIAALALTAVAAQQGGPGEQQGSNKVGELAEKAMALDKKGDYKGAMEAFEEAAEEAASDSGMFNNLGVATMRYATDLVNKRRRVQGKKMFQKACEHYRKAIELDADSYYAAENLKGALAALQANFRLKPSKDDLELLEEAGLEYDEKEILESTRKDQEARQREGAQGNEQAPHAVGTHAGNYQELNLHWDPKEGGEEEEEEGEQELMEDFEMPESTHKALVKARKYYKQGKYDKAVAALCHDFDNLRVGIPLAERLDGAPSRKTIRWAVTALQVCGAVAMDRPIARATVRTLAHRQAKDFERSIANLDPAIDAQDTFELTDIAKRSRGRYEISNPLRMPYTDPAIVNSPFVMPVLQATLGHRIEMDTFSMITSVPGATTQHWHEDAGMLDPAKHLPAHGIVQFTALDDVTDEMGPTEFVLGSHIVAHPQERIRISLPAGDDITDGTMVMRVSPWSVVDKLFSTPARAGSVVLFDFRITHRGGPNKSSRRRALQYTTFMREWYRDSVNFHVQQTESFDSLSPWMRKLFTRLDARQYVTQLEGLLRERGVEPKELQSDYDFMRFSFDKEMRADRVWGREIGKGDTEGLVRSFP